MMVTSAGGVHAPETPAVVSAPAGQVDPPPAGDVLQALPFAVLAVGEDGRIVLANPAAEQFLDRGAARLVGRPLEELFPLDSPLFSLISQARASGSGVTEHDVPLPRRAGNGHVVTVAPAGENGRQAIVSFHARSIARRFGSRMVHRHAARSVSGLAALLAHEVRNPLAGIRGAAQLLEETLDGEDDRALTRMIRDESDRICRLVDRMDLFSEDGISRRDVNVHAVLEHVRRIAEAGFGRHVRFVESYDPSLPPTGGDSDRLVQAFLNIVKNACEEVPEHGGEIRLGTAYHHGLRLRLPGGGSRAALPLVVSIADNGPGIREEMADQIFDPFVTTKADGSGLGLALAAKTVADHGGTIEFDSGGGGTVFRVRLPAGGDPQESDPR